MQGRACLKAVKSGLAPDSSVCAPHWSASRPPRPGPRALVSRPHVLPLSNARDTAGEASKRCHRLLGQACCHPLAGPPPCRPPLAARSCKAHLLFPHPDLQPWLRPGAAKAGMGSTCRKRKQRDHEAPRLASEGLAGAILALPPQPQPICCRVEGCREALAPGYHKVRCQLAAGWWEGPASQRLPQRTAGASAHRAPSGQAVPELSSPGLAALPPHLPLSSLASHNHHAAEGGSSRSALSSHPCVAVPPLPLLAGKPLC